VVKKCYIRFIPLFVFVALCVVSCGDRGDITTLRFSHILGQNSDWQKGAERFKELVEERTGGSIRVIIYPDGQIAASDQRTELEMVQSGVIDCSFESTILLSLIDPGMSVVSLPWLFDSYDRAFRILDGPAGDSLLARLPVKGITGLAFGANGFRQLTNARNPVRTPDDLRGMKVRVPSIKMYIDLFRLLGADPSSMNFGELFTALAQGTMDGQENPLSVIATKRLFEVQKYLTIWNYSYDPIVLCINNRRWESFDAETQRIIAECARDAMRYEREAAAAGEAAFADTLRSKGMEIDTLEGSALDPFRILAEPIYGQYAPIIGEELLGIFTSAMEGYRVP
jgi:TRAP-type transport system periplasmic protein